ncbi:MAG: hypothetical protein KatS3mg057_1881 [Herpetosiphonaceae bacterium]|nr:MAG: hypothetical protein KatS3mg057_1881 [Herpetosiphonaceae bacterium]
MRTKGIIPSADLFARFSVIVIDFEEGAASINLTKSILSSIIANQNNAEKAWDTLCKEGFQLIKFRGAGIIRAL